MQGVWLLSYEKAWAWTAEFMSFVTEDDLEIDSEVRWSITSSLLVSQSQLISRESRDNRLALFASS